MTEGKETMSQEIVECVGHLVAARTILDRERLPQREAAELWKISIAITEIEKVIAFIGYWLKG
jgi:hypothetical protein